MLAALVDKLRERLTGTRRRWPGIRGNQRNRTERRRLRPAFRIVRDSDGFEYILPRAVR